MPTHATQVAVIASAHTAKVCAFDALMSYKAGDSLSWFFDLKTESQKKAKAPMIAKKLLRAIDSGKLNDESFRLACILLKPISPDSEATVDVMKKFLGDKAKVSPACDVLLVLSDNDVDDALEDALEAAIKANDEICAMTIISTIAARGNDLDVIAKIANSENKKLASFALVALGRFVSDDAIDVLEEIVAKNDCRKKNALRAINSIASTAFMTGEVRLARRAIELVPESCPQSVYVRAATVQKNNEAYLDSLIAKGGALSQAAGRARNTGRTFDNSQELIAKFQTLPRDAKLASIASFMITRDTRFFPTIAPEMDSADSDIRALAIYSARFICTDEANLQKIYQIFSTKGDCWQLARNVLAENPSFAIKGVLQKAADAGDLAALEILVERGDINARNRLLGMFLDSKTRNSKISQAVENTIRYSELKELASHFKGNDEALSKEIAKVIIKKLAKTKDKEFNARATKEIIGDNLPADSKLRKFIYSKLSIK